MRCEDSYVYLQMVEWLRTEILMEDNLKDRVARMSKILEIANVSINL